MISEAKRQRNQKEAEYAFLQENEKKLQLELFDIEQKRKLLILEKKMNQEQANEWAQSEKKRAQEDYQIAQSQRTFEFGWKKAFSSYAENATNYAKLGEQAFVSVTNNMEAALDRFVQTGKLNFKELAASIIQDLIKIQLKAQATSLFGGIGDLIGGLFNFGGSSGAGAYTHSVFSAGGNELGAGQPSMVGENGPEMFIPRSAGTIVPNNRMNSLLGGQPSVVYNGPYIANMSAIDTQSGLQFLAKNKQGVWAANQSAQRGLPQSR
jgi:lambda family phage tail tape measure protein